MISSHVAFKCNRCADRHNPCACAFENSRRFTVTPSTLREELLLRLQQSVFEQAVLDVLIAMGYGGSLGKATRTQLSNDGGIDGVIDQDALGLSRICVQAKRYATSHAVGRPEVQAFVGALHGAQANQGVFLTTSGYVGYRTIAAVVQERVIGSGD